MKAIKLLFIGLLFVGCTPNEDAVDCNCGTITKVEANPTNTQWKYTLTSDCGDVTTYESRVEILQVGSRKCN
jgi:hypothetical protein